MATVTDPDGRDTRFAGSIKLVGRDSENEGRSPVYLAADPQTIDMNDAQLALNMTDGATNQIRSNILYVDPNSSGGTEDLLLPPEADCKGLELHIVNTAGGAEDIVVKEDGDSTNIMTLNQNEQGVCVCDGTTWRGATLSSTSEQAFLSGVTAGTVTASKAAVVDSNKDIGDFRNLDVTNLDAGLSGTAGSVDVFPSTASKGKLTLVAADSSGDTQTKITNASQASARTYTVPDAGADANFAMSEGAQTLNGVKTFGSIPVIAGVEYQMAMSGAKIGATSGWAVKGAADLYEATLPQSQSNSTLIIPVGGLMIGSTITAFKIAAQIESAGGTVTIDADLRKQTVAAGDPTDASVGTITQVSVTADAAVAAAKTGLSEVVAADEWLYILIKATTAGTTDIRFLGCTVTVTEG